jgi:phosphoglycerate dehydrogenase-like enzyme
MTRIAVLDDYLHLASRAADWATLNADIEFFADTLHDQDQLVARLAPFDVIVMTRERTFFPREVLERLPKLKLLAGTGRRQNNVDLDAASELGIPVCITTGGGGHGNSTAELTWGLMLALTRHLAWEDAQMRQGRWQTRLADGLGGKTLAIMGLGRIGRVVAEYARAFEMDIIAWGPTLDAQRAARSGAERVEWDELFARADVLTIHVPLSDTSRGWIKARELALMKESAFLINTSRGPIIEQEALLDALRTRQIAGAALDVYDIEPLPANHPLLALDNVLLSPHLGYSTETMLRQFFRDSVDNIKAWIDGAPSNVLNAEVLEKRRR